MNICKVYTRPLPPVFVFKRDLDLATFLTLRAEACNIKGCFFPMKFYFVDDSSIICPSGFDLKLAFMDQEGLFRVGSINSNLSKKQIIENCIRQKEVKQATTPNYMKPTHSSAAKTKKPITPHPRSTPALLRPVQNQDEFLVTLSQDFSTSNIFTNDLSEISADSFRSAQISFEDSLYAKRSFPQNMFDDKGDIAYGTGLLGLLVSFICTLMKLILEKQKNKHLSGLHLHQPSTLLVEESKKHLPTTYTLLIEESNNRNNYSEQLTTRNLAPLASHSKDLANDETSNQHFHTALPLPPLASQLDILALKKYYNCPKSNCIQGNCHCFKAKRACRPLCHGGAGTSTNCKATAEYAERVYHS